MNRKLLWIIKLIVYVALFFPAAYGWFILLYIVSDVPILQYILLIVGAALYIGLGILIFRFKVKKPEAASQTVPDRSAKIKQFKTGAVFFAAAILVIIGILLFPTFMRNMERLRAKHAYHTADEIICYQNDRNTHANLMGTPLNQNTILLNYDWMHVTFIYDMSFEQMRKVRLKPAAPEQTTDNIQFVSPLSGEGKTLTVYGNENVVTGISVICADGSLYYADIASENLGFSDTAYSVTQNALNQSDEVVPYTDAPAK